MNNFQKYKFRGKRSPVDGGGYVYGNLIYRYGKVYIEDGITHDNYSVEEENVALLVGYIKCGGGYTEVYEGDKLRTSNGDIVYATVQRFFQAGRYDHPIDLTEHGDGLELMRN